MSDDRMRAMIRLLIDSGDMTPAARRQVLKVWDAATKAEPATIDREGLRGAIMNVLCSASNFPEAFAAQPVTGHSFEPPTNRFDEGCTRCGALPGEDVKCEVPVDE